MKSGYQHRPLSAYDRPAVDVGQHFDIRPDPLDDRCTYEHRVDGAAVHAGDVEVGLEAVDLAAEGVAAHADVDAGERYLVGAAVEDVPRQQDHAGARAERRHAVAQPLDDRLPQARRVEQAAHGGGLAARHDQRVDGGEVFGAADIDRVR